MSERPIEKTVKELCLVCRGERWLPEILEPSRSRPCPYCHGEGWVTVAPSSLEEGAATKTPPSA